MSTRVSSDRYEWLLRLSVRYFPFREQAPNMEAVQFTNIVSVYASFLRRKIDQVTGRNLIHSLPGAGYILKDRICFLASVHC